MQVDDVDGHAYEPSLASTASSSQASIWSAGSVSSSIASSVSDDFRASQDDAARDKAYANAQISHLPSQQQCWPIWEETGIEAPAKATCPSYADVTSVPTEQRINPRRCSLSRNQKPPTLQRQCERKINFVDNLVESATQMVEVIWPLSTVACRGEGGSGRGVLPLRTYIEETLRRSRTSYSTLQVALYYLVLIKAHVPKTDFTHEQTVDCASTRALMCGRRMFLAALILASKYLQDRNYSAKAWSKMSGLRVAEINANERTYLEKINWKLHIPEAIFKRWTDVVLQFTPNAPPPSPGVPTLTWKTLVPSLTPELDMVLAGTTPRRPTELRGSWQQTSSPLTPTPTKNAFAALEPESSESTPLALPRTLEPRVDIVAPPTPALARQGPLPTPQLTPSTVASNTPAVSVCSSTSRRPSISSAMAMAQQAGFNRCAMEQYPYPAYPASRRPSMVSASSRSSPESMISDRSRSSRASSISSISTVSSTSSMAPSRAPCLAKQATCRNARLPCPPAPVAEEKAGSLDKPIVIADDEVEMAASPEVIDFSLSDKALHTPSKHTKFASQPVAATHQSRKRARPTPRGGRRSDLHEEVRLMLEEAEEDLMDVDDEEDIRASPSPAADYATRMLSRSNSVVYTNKEVQPPAALSRKGSGRMPIQRNGSMSMKRSCCSSRASGSPMNAPLYGEVA